MSPPAKRAAMGLYTIAKGTLWSSAQVVETGLKAVLVAARQKWRGTAGTALVTAGAVPC